MQLTDDQIIRLSPPERLTMIEQLWGSLDANDVPVTSAQQDELARRLMTFEDDRARGVTWETLKAELNRQS